MRTPSGEVPIESLKKADEIIGFSVETGFVPATIKRTVAHKKASFLEIRFKDLSAPLRVSSLHPILTLKGWKRAALLTPEDAVMHVSKSGGVQTMTLEKIEQSSKESELYHLVVGSPYCYLADGFVSSTFVYFAGIRMMANQFFDGNFGRAGISPPDKNALYGGSV